jgi:Fe2+ transport system protein FeoA
MAAIPWRCKQLTHSVNHLILKWSDIGMPQQANLGISGQLTLADLRKGQRCVLDRLDLSKELAQRLMELGFLPGNEVTLGRRAPGGGPRVYRVDGSEVALRRDTAQRLFIRRDPESDLVVLK